MFTIASGPLGTRQHELTLRVGMPCQGASVFPVLRPLRSDARGCVRLRGLRTGKSESSKESPRDEGLLSLSEGGDTMIRGKRSQWLSLAVVIGCCGCSSEGINGSDGGFNADG